MAEIKWNDRYNTGVEVVDKAHQRLFSIVGKLLSLNEDADKQQHACREGIKYFKSYTLKHFAEEEAYMQSINYDGYEIHKSLHDNMKYNTIPALENELETQNYSMEAVQHFLGICVGWLNGHILIEDRAISGKISNKWVHKPSEDEIDSLQKSIMQSMQSLLFVNSSPVSVHYSGEDFSSGNALCYRMTYLSPDKERFQVFVIYEEQMIIKTINDMLSKQIKRIDKTVVYAMKVLSQKLVDCVAANFPISNTYELQKSDIMTFDQLTNAFDRQFPKYSLLFRTGFNHYFAFCIR